MIKQGVVITYNFLMELILTILILFLVYYIPVEGFPPLLWLFGISLVAFILFLFLLNIFSGLGRWLYFVSVFPLLLYLGVHLDIPLIQMIILGILIFWRGISLFKESTVQSNTIFLFIFLITGISLTILTGSSEYKQQNVIISLYIIQIMLVLIGLFLNKWSAIHENRGKFLLYFSGFLAGAALIGVAITFGLKLVKYIASGIFLIVGYGLTYLLRFGYFIVHFLGKLFGIESFQEFQAEDLEYIPHNYQGRFFKQLHDHPRWFGLILLAAIVVVAYIIYKKKKKVVLSTESHPSMLQISEEVSLNKGGFFFKRRSKPPKDQVRREIFFLEKFASKLKMGRRPFESITEWWARIGVHESGELSKIYEHVRYGEVPSTIDDVSKVKVEIIQIKEQFKEKS